MRTIKIFTLITLLSTAIACGGEDNDRSYQTGQQDNLRNTSNDSSNSNTSSNSSNSNNSEDTCLADNCGGEIRRCTTDCQDLLSCISGCSAFPSSQQDDCVGACVYYSTESAVNQLSDLLSCNEAMCL